MNKEPAVIVAILAALVQIAVMWTSNDATADISWAMPILTVIGGVITRTQVFSHNTIREAGLRPSDVALAAADPRVPRLEDPKR